ncbi:MAG: hypothetical protein JST20_12885 [Bacteroidetes bacterium]|nr:hypothetical protein [Bacteroidota bacterium]
MIKTVIIPQSESYSLTIPKNYIGKKLEVLLYAFDELVEEKAIAKKKPSDFFGTLSKEEGEKFHTYITKAREEWDRNI